MKKKSIITGCVLLSLVMPLSAQSLSKAEASYSEFNKLRASGSSEASIYNALYHSYENYVAVLNSSSSESPEYAAAKRALREMMPYLQMGAAWSSNNRQMTNAVLFAQAYMDIPMLPAFKNDTFMKDANYAQMAHFAASGTFNARQYQKAIPYFRAYLDTGEQKDRENIYAFMAKACMEAKDFNMAMDVINEATNVYPNNYNMLSMAINNCLERDDNVNLQKFVEKAVKIKPNDVQLLNIQGKMYENIQEFQKALSVFNKLDKLKPNNLGIAKHLALNYYNLGVTFYNKVMMEQNESTAKRYNRQANDYFSAAAAILENVVANDPSATAYAEALAISYSCTKDKENLDKTNEQLASMGIRTVDENTVPVLMTYEGGKAKTDIAQARPQVNSTVEAPKYSVFAKSYVESRIGKWQQKSEFETVDEYQARVTEKTREDKKNELLKLAEKEYVKTYTKNIKFNDMVLKSYDADNNSYLVESKYGNLIVPVPRKNNEAQVFKSSWSGMQFKDPQFYISNDQLMLSSLTFVTPTGNTYRFDNSKDMVYKETVVDLSFDPIDVNPIASNIGSGKQKISKEKISVKRGKSDVDVNIPESKTVNDRTFAVVIANENYDMVTPVSLAINDGTTFSEYCQKTLGLPKENVRLYTDASYGIMLRAVRDIKDIAGAYNGNINIIFYYAGHGVPNEETKDAFILPVDADGAHTDGCYSLKRLYKELGELNAKQIVVFLDACFSGAKRDGGMLASARGVALKAKKAEAQGNMVVFSAASDAETALPWNEKEHGLFTYFLLKKLQESKGGATLKELGDYIASNVKQKSSVVNHKSQTPTVIPSSSLSTTWESLKLK